MRALSREDFVPSQCSRVCSNHFQQSDFVEVHDDSNSTRQKLQADAKLMHRRLKDAVPSIFHNLPSYMTNKGTFRRSTTMATASSRHEREEQQQELLAASFKEIDDVTSLQLGEIERRLLEEATRPSGFRTAVDNESLQIYLTAVEDTVMIITASIIVSANLKLTVSVHGQPVAASKLRDLIADKLLTMSQLTNVMARVKTWAEEPQSQSFDFLLLTAIKCLEKARDRLNESDEDTETPAKIAFSMDHLRLTLFSTSVDILHDPSAEQLNAVTVSKH